MTEEHKFSVEEVATNAVQSFSKHLEEIRASKDQVESDLEAARQSGDKKRVGELLVALATVLAAQADFKGAVKQLKESQAIYQKLKMAQKVAELRLMEGKLRHYAGQKGQAKAVLGRASVTLERMGKLVQAADAHTEIGSILSSSGSPKEAVVHYRMALDLLQKADQPEGSPQRMEALQGIAAASQGSGDVLGAIEGFRQIEAEANAMGDPQGALHAASAVAGLLGLYGKSEQAEKAWRECVRAARILGDKGVEAQCLGNLATLAAEYGRDDEAFQLANETKSLASMVGDTGSFLGVSVLLAALHAKRGDSEGACRALCDAEDMIVMRGGELEAVQKTIEPYMDALRQRLGKETYEKAMDSCRRRSTQ